MEIIGSDTYITNDSIKFIGVYENTPSFGSNYDVYVNKSDNNTYLYLSGNWNKLNFLGTVSCDSTVINPFPNIANTYDIICIFNNYYCRYASNKSAIKLSYQGITDNINPGHYTDNTLFLYINGNIRKYICYFNSKWNTLNFVGKYLAEEDVDNNIKTTKNMVSIYGGNYYIYLNSRWERNNAIRYCFINTDIEN